MSNNVTITVAGAELQADVERFNPAVLQYVITYGLRQMLNDVHAGITKDVEPDDTKRTAAKVAAAEAKLASLYAGEVARARVGGGGDPVRTEARRLAEADLTNAIRAQGKKVAESKKLVDKDGNSVWLAAVERLIEKWLPQAKKNVEARGKATVDLGDLGL